MRMLSVKYRNTTCRRVSSPMICAASTCDRREMHSGENTIFSPPAMFMHMCSINAHGECACAGTSGAHNIMQYIIVRNNGGLLIIVLCYSMDSENKTVAMQKKRSNENSPVHKVTTKRLHLAIETQYVHRRSQMFAKLIQTYISGYELQRSTLPSAWNPTRTTSISRCPAHPRYPAHLSRLVLRTHRHLQRCPVHRSHRAIFPSTLHHKTATVCERCTTGACECTR